MIRTYTAPAAPLIALAMLALVGGCAPQAATVLPIAAMATSETMAATGSAMGSKEPTADDQSGQRDRCDQLLATPPGVEEVRLAADRTIWSREIRLDRSRAHPQWVVHRDHNSKAEGWRPQIGIARLQFDPPLDEFLSKDDNPKFLAYAPMVPEKPRESEQMTSIAANFGSQTGRFKWRGRIYSYTVVKKLPCFPGPE
jgi:hypothetical protein